MNQSLLELLLEPLARSFTESQAEQILSWKLSEDQEERLQYLRERANEGLLSDEEDREYKQVVDDLDVIAIIQAKARLAPSECAA